MADQLAEYRAAMKAKFERQKSASSMAGGAVLSSDETIPSGSSEDKAAGLGAILPVTVPVEAKTEEHPPSIVTQTPVPQAEPQGQLVQTPQSSSAAAREVSLSERLAAASVETGGLQKALGTLSQDVLEMPISSLLSDAPPPAKRPRTEDIHSGGIQVPKDKTAEIRQLLANPSPSTVAVMSWNIDGLDDVGGPQGLMLRTLDVALAIAKARPVAVLLQECVPPALQLLDAKQVLGSAYDFLVPKDPPMPYYVAILLDKKRTQILTGPDTVDFPTTQMGRQLLSVTLVVDDIREKPLVLATAHLESTKDHAAERKRQLNRSMRFMCSSLHFAKALGRAPCTPSCIFGGDMNLRDEELKVVQRDIGDDCKAIVDVWSWCGSDDSEKYTWDTYVNTNGNCNFQYRSRFDRLFYLTPGISDVPKPKAKGKAKAKGNVKAPGSDLDTKPGWRPISFKLVGKEKIKSLNRFPSDHWGMLSVWSCGHEPSPAPITGTSSEVIDLD